MRVNNFSVLIPEGVERDSGHVELQHGGVYTLRLLNHDHSRRCDALVVVDGKEIGAFRVGTGGSIVLERPAHDTGRFTFFKSESAEAGAAGVAGVANADRGLVQVTFKPERQRIPRVGSVRPQGMSRGGPCGQSVGGGHGMLRAMPRGLEGTTTPDCDSGFVPLSAGVTGLTGKSNQEFVTVANLDYDPAAEVTISIRLVHVDVPAVRPLTAAPRGNPVPAPV